MEKFHQSDKVMASNSKEVARKIMICRILLDRVIKQEYPCWDKHNKKWGNRKFNWIENVMKIEIENVKTKKDEKQESKEFKRYCMHEEMLIKQDYDYLFKLLNKHIRGWWD